MRRPGAKRRRTASSPDRRRRPAQPGWLRQLSRYIWPQRQRLLLTLLAGAVATAAMTAGPLMQKVTVDGAVLSHSLPLWPLVGVMIALAGVRFGAAYVWRYQGGVISLAVQRRLRNEIYDHVQRLDGVAESRLQNGQLIARSSSDLTMVQQLVNWVPMAVGNILNVILSLAVMVVLCPLLAVLVALVLSSVVIAIQFLRRNLYAASWDAQDKEGLMANMVEEAATGVRVVKGFGQERAEIRAMHRALESMFGARVRMLRIRARLTSTVQAIPALGQVLVLTVGGILVLENRITVGVFLAFLSYLAGLAGPARMLGTMMAMAPRVRASAERLLEILSLGSEVADPDRPAAAPPAGGAVRFENVTFGYPDSEPVLRDFNLTVEPGERVAIVGPSGGGKSTALQLLLRVWDPAAGRISLDGVDVRELPIPELRKRIGIAPQETFLFDGTIAENIAYGRPDASQAEIEAAARIAGVDFVHELPDGFETMVGSEGLSLSGGQRQRVALARALLTEPEVLVLDDVTASVDAETERSIVRGLDRVMADRTTLMIVYRLSSIQLCDRVVLVDDGRVVAQGRHQDLLCSSSLYRHLLAELEAEPEWAAGTVASAHATEQVPVDPWARRPPARSLHIAAAPTPELEGLIERLPPLRDEAGIDLESESERDERFRLSTFLRPYTRPLLLCFVIIAADAICTLASPLFVRSAENAISGHSVLVFGALCAGFLAVTLFDWWDMAAENLWTCRTGERVLLALRARIYGQIHRLGLDFYDRFPAGRILTRMTSDVDALSNLLQTGVISAVLGLLSFVGMAAVVVFLDWKLALLILVVVPPTAAVSVWYRRTAGAAYDEARQLVSALNTRQHEALAGIRVTQAFRREDENIRRFRLLSQRQFRASTRGTRATALYASLIDFESLTMTALVLGIGGMLAMQGQLNVGTLVAFLLYLASVFAPVQQLVQVLDSYQRARAGSARIKELLDLRTTVPSLPDARSIHVEGEVELQNAGLRYATTREYALRGVDLKIQAGERIALVGRTGAGKSSIAKLVARFYDPTQGRVLVDGQPLKDISLESYHSQLGYVPQEPFLFSRSVRDNIAYGRPDASDATVEAAARAVGAQDFIARLPYGYHQQLAERGRSLSAGERQLLCLARAMVSQPRVLILDEPTANLDMASERRVSRAMEAASRGRTTVLVSHRPSAHAWVDRIIKVAGGTIVSDSDAAPVEVALAEEDESRAS